jgi:ribokinase
MRRKNKITTIGGATRDIMFYTDDMLLIDNKKDLLRQKLIAFEWGAKVYSDKVYFTWGGGGANTAISLANLGIKTRTILSLGDDLVAQEILQHLKKKNIDTSLIQRHSKKQTGTSFIANVGQLNEHVIFAYRGANNDINLSSQVLRKINTPWVYVSSLPSNFGSKMSVLFTGCHDKDQNIAWNPGSNQLKMGLPALRKFMAKTCVFIVNRDEALGLLVSDKKIKTKNNINFILRNLHKAGQQVTVVTDGRKGAYVFDGKKVYFHKAIGGKGINTTGAGDSFGSAFVAGLIKYDWNIDKALKLAILNSAHVIKKIGAQEGLLKSSDLKKYKL